jgi:hypothetical protein
MPRQECKPIDERLRFIARLLEGEKIAPLCREFGISQVTGHKLLNWYRECGLDAFNDRSRRPCRHANKLPDQVERTVLGAPKIRDKLIRALLGGDRQISPELFARMVSLFAPQGTIEITMVMGGYTMTAMLLNAVDQHLPRAGSRCCRHASLRTRASDRHYSLLSW